MSLKSSSHFGAMYQVWADMAIGTCITGYNAPIEAQDVSSQPYINFTTIILVAIGLPVSFKFQPLT